MMKKRFSKVAIILSVIILLTFLLINNDLLSVNKKVKKINYLSQLTDLSSPNKVLNTEEIIEKYSKALVYVLLKKANLDDELLNYDNKDDFKTNCANCTNTNSFPNFDATCCCEYTDFGTSIYGNEIKEELILPANNISCKQLLANEIAGMKTTMGDKYFKMTLDDSYYSPEKNLCRILIEYRDCEKCSYKAWKPVVTEYDAAANGYSVKNCNGFSVPQTKANEKEFEYRIFSPKVSRMMTIENEDGTTSQTELVISKAKCTIYKYTRECACSGGPGPGSGEKPEPIETCYDAQNGGTSYYLQYKNGTMSLDTFVNDKKCCVPLENNTVDRKGIVDRDGKNFYDNHCPKPTKMCFSGESSYKADYDAIKKPSQTDIDLYKNKCCKPAAPETVDQAKKNMGAFYTTHCDAEPVKKVCFSGTDNYKKDYEAGKITLDEYKNKCCTPEAEAIAGMGEDFYNKNCPPTKEPICFSIDKSGNKVFGHKLYYYDEYLKMPSIKLLEQLFDTTGKYDYKCCDDLAEFEPTIRDTIIDANGNKIWETKCVPQINPTACFSGTNSYKEQYNDGKGSLSVNEYTKKCCVPPAPETVSQAKENLGDLYSKYCETPTACFSGKNSYEEQYNDGKGTLSAYEYTKNCCVPPAPETVSQAKAKLGDLYGTYCQTSIKPLCFSGPNSEKQIYSNSSKTTADINRYKNLCCKPAAPETEDEAKLNMGSFYQTNCIEPNADKCAPVGNEIICSQDSDAGYIYEAGEKGLTSNNLACLTNVEAKDVYNYVIPEFKDNKYCKIACKEDVDFYFPGYGINPNSENPYLIAAGQYFKFKPYISNSFESELLPVINQSRSCVMNLFPDTLSLDIYGNTNFTKNANTFSYYGAAEDYLKAYYNYTQDIQNIDKVLEVTTNQDKINELNTIRNERVAFRNFVAQSYAYYVDKMNKAISQYNQCNNFINEYNEKDYPSVDNFWYFEMETKNTKVSDELKKIKMKIKDQTVVTADKNQKYCNDSLNNCKVTPESADISSFNSALPDKISGSMGGFIANQNKTQKIFVYDYKINETKIDTNYTTGEELYVIKPTGLTVVGESPLFKNIKDTYTFNYLGYGLPVNVDTFGGKRYNYQFLVKNIGKADGSLNTLFKNIQQDKRTESGTMYVCNYEVSNKIVCPPTTCKIDCSDPLNCVCKENCDTVTQMVLQAVFRPVNNSNINPNDRTLGTNWSDEKGIAAKAKIEEDGDEIYASPQYSFTLNTNKILEIRKYNDQNTYASFEMTCNQFGDRCESKFVEKFADKISGTWIEYDQQTKKFIEKN